MTGFKKIALTLIALFSFAQATVAQFEMLPDTSKVNFVLNQLYRLRSTQPDSAIYYIEHVLPITIKNQDAESQVKLLLEKASCHYYLKEIEEELQADLEALKIAQNMGDKSLQGEVYFSLAMYYNRQTELDKSMEMNKKAINLCREVNNRSCMANNLRNIGRVFIKQNNVDSAEHYFNLSYQIKVEDKDSIGLPYAFNDFSEVAAIRGDLQKSVAYLEKSNAIRIAIKDSTGLAINLHNTSNILEEAKEYEKAKNYMEQAIALGKRVKYAEFVDYSLYRLAKLNLKLNYNDEALANMDERQTLKDSSFKAERSKVLAEMETKYETETKNLTIEKQSAQLREQKWAAFAIVSCLLLLGGVFYYRVYKKRKHEAQIKELEMQRKLQAERERISKDLHDSVGAQLTKIVTDLDIIGLKTPQTEDLEKTRSFASNTIHQLRDTIWAIHKDHYSYTEFADKISDYLRIYLGENVNWELKANLNRNESLTPNEALNLIRIVQEATQNMLKHSQANKYTLTLMASEYFELIIEDNGIGIEENANTKEQYGLTNMKKRADSIGANLDISRLPQGTRLYLKMAV